MDSIRLGYIFRIDDITPGTNWKNFSKIENIFDKYGIKPIIGVVPNNKDAKLDGYGNIKNFWGKIKKMYDKGWIIAQHGYEHNYETKDSGIIGLNQYSEFAGLSYEKQFEKISKGKKILEKNLGIKIKWWMAPAHSFDQSTCKIIKKLGFEYITDGIALYPFEKYGLKRLPQQIWKPKNKFFGIWTICLHINKYDDVFIKKIENFCQKNGKNIINNPKGLNYKNSIIKNIFGYVLNINYRIKNFIFREIMKIKKLITLPYKKTKELKNYGGFFAFIKGLFTVLNNYNLQKKYNFDKWHILPVERRPYTKFIYDYINKSSKGGLVIEIGCGLGEILNKIKNKEKVGLDIFENVIKGAKEKNKKINYKVGSFEDINNNDIEYLITVNFIHGINSKKLKEYYQKITSENNIKYIIVDEIKNNKNYEFNHNFLDILPKNYRIINKSEIFEGNRQILIFQKY